MWPLDCPECQRQGKEASLQQIKNLGEWRAHVHEDHAPSDEEPFWCLLGCKTFGRRREMNIHLKNNYSELWIASEPLPCPECECQGTGDYFFTDLTEFWQHVELYHGLKHLPSPETLVHQSLMRWHDFCNAKRVIKIYNSNLC